MFLPFVFNFKIRLFILFLLIFLFTYKLKSKISLNKCIKVNLWQKMNPKGIDIKYSINPKNFKEFIELIPEIRNATRLGIKREFDEYKTKIQDAEYFYPYILLSRKKWTFDILDAIELIGEPYFNDLRNTLPLINTRTLSTRLNSLSKLDIIERIVHDTRPVRVSYKMTPFGRGLRSLYASIFFYITLTKKNPKEDKK